MLRSVLIDDEIASIDSLEILLKDSPIQIEVVGKASDIVRAKLVIERTKPDLVFLDIEMPGGTGFDLLDSLSEIGFRVIFVTAYNQYAIKAFKYAAVDYILKPIDISALYAAISRVNATADGLPSQIGLMKEVLQVGIPKRIALSSIDAIEVVETSNIVQFEAEGNYTKVYLVNGKSLLVSKSIKDFEDIVEPSMFFRCHKSHLVNFAHIEKVVKRQNAIIMVDDSLAYISRRKKNEFYELMDSFLQK